MTAVYLEIAHEPNYFSLKRLNPNLKCHSRTVLSTLRKQNNELKLYLNNKYK